MEQADRSHKLAATLPQSVSAFDFVDHTSSYIVDILVTCTSLRCLEMSVCVFFSGLKIHYVDDDLCVLSHTGSVAPGMVMSVSRSVHHFDPD